MKSSLTQLVLLLSLSPFAFPQLAVAAWDCNEPELKACKARILNELQGAQIRWAETRQQLRWIEFALEKSTRPEDLLRRRESLGRTLQTLQRVIDLHSDLLESNLCRNTNCTFDPPERFHGQIH